MPGQEASCEAEKAVRPEAPSQTEISVAAQELQVTNAAAREQVLLHHLVLSMSNVKLCVPAGASCCTISVMSCV